jgi:hypothetical protein
MVWRIKHGVAHQPRCGVSSSAWRTKRTLKTCVAYQPGAKCPVWRIKQNRTHQALQDVSSTAFCNPTWCIKSSLESTQHGVTGHTAWLTKHDDVHRTLRCASSTPMCIEHCDVHQNVAHHVERVAIHSMAHQAQHGASWPAWRYTPHARHGATGSSLCTMHSWRVKPCDAFQAQRYATSAVLRNPHGLMYRARRGASIHVCGELCLAWHIKHGVVYPHCQSRFGVSSSAWRIQTLWRPLCV